MIRESTHEIDAVMERYREVMAPEDFNHYYTFRGDFEGHSIKFSSHRLWTFHEKGTACVNCGLEGVFFAKEKHHDGEESFHLNLYALDDAGEEVLLTKDHIVPKSKDGDDHISNYQPMCAPCNEQKADS